MTQVINLIGGSGLGKSTTAAGLFAEMKLRGYHVELVTEYVKKWAWQGKKIDPLDQPLIFGKQAQAESMLYGKADWVVTDSPLLLSALYEEFYNGKSIIKPSVLNFLEAAAEKGVKHHNFFLTRNKPFDTRGRYETEETAKKVDEFMKSKLKELDVTFFPVECEDRQRTPQILKALGLDVAKG
jgi:nicotinamide riboside kinase